MRFLINYFKESWQELNKVNWPNRKKSIKLTIAVLILAFTVAMFMGIIDIGLADVVKRIFIGN